VVRVRDDRPPVRTAEIVDRISDAFFALDREWRFTYLNDRAEDMLECSRERLLGQVFWDEFPETVETQFPQGFHHAMETQEPVAFEFYHKPLETYFEARAYPSESGLTVSLRDVTDRKERERDLVRYRTVVEAINDGVLAIEADDRVGFANGALAAALDVDPVDLVGDHVERLFEAAEIDAEDAAAIGHALDQLRRGDVDDRRFEVSYTARDGGDRVAEIQLVLLDEERVAGVVRDVTESRRFERVVTSLHSVTPELLDADGQLEVASIAVHAAGEVLDLRVSGVWLIDEERNRLDPVAATAGAHEELGGLPHFPRGEGVVWKAFREGEPAVYDDVREHEAHDHAQLRSQIVVPVGDHGVLMAGETTTGVFDETDLELATILGANTEAALDRTERDQMLRRSKDTLERQNERLEVVERVLSGEVHERLARAVRRAEDVEAETVLRPLRRARRLTHDAVELAHGDLSVRPRAPVEAGEVATAAADAVEGVTVEVERGAWLRADRERLLHLFETLLVDARRRAETTRPVTADRAAVIDPDGAREFGHAPTEPTGDAETAEDSGQPGDSAPPDGPVPGTGAGTTDGGTTAGEPVTVRVTASGTSLRVTDDAPPLPEDERTEAFDLERATRTRAGEDDEGQGLGLAVAGAIAGAHGWTIRAGAEDGTGCFVIEDVTTLEPTE
jgi:PAS domain S-box-containing protein